MDTAVFSYLIPSYYWSECVSYWASRWFIKAKRVVTFDRRRMKAKDLAFKSNSERKRQIKRERERDHHQDRAKNRLIRSPSRVFNQVDLHEINIHHHYREELTFVSTLLLIQPLTLKCTDVLPLRTNWRLLRLSWRTCLQAKRRGEKTPNPPTAASTGGTHTNSQTLKLTKSPSWQTLRGDRSVLQPVQHRRGATTCLRRF